MSITKQQQVTVDCILGIAQACGVKARLTDGTMDGNVCVNIEYGDGVGHGGGGLWVDRKGYYKGGAWTREERAGGWQFVTCLAALGKHAHEEYEQAKADAEERARRRTTRTKKGA